MPRPSLSSPSLAGCRLDRNCTSYAELGGLITYGPDRLEGYRKAAEFVDKLLRGAKVADLPIEQASQFELVINTTTAKALGLRISQSLQSRARLI
jgi:putative tryptophan/tyrosine transport system substrate-binding protein